MAAAKTNIAAIFKWPKDAYAIDKHPASRFREVIALGM
jgi:hypothetical protein